MNVVKFWMLSKAQEMRRGDACLDYTGSGEVLVSLCDGQRGHQLWDFNQVLLPTYTLSLLFLSTAFCIHLTAFCIL